MHKSVLLSLMILACRSSGGTNPSNVDAPGSGSNVDAPPGGASTIKAIRMALPADGAPVSVTNVVVVSHVTSSKYGHIWVQDAGGGQYSGIQLFCNYGGTTPNCTMTRAAIDALAVGTVINVSGAFSNFLPSSAPAGAQASLEISMPVITATGQTMAPVAVDVPAATIAKAQLSSTESDPYKGAYVHVTGGPFTVSTNMAAEYSQTCTDMSTPTPKMGTTFSGFETTGGSSTLAVGLGFYNSVTYCIPCAGVPKPYACNNPITNQAFSNVSGIVEPEYSNGGMVYLQIAPTTDADLAL